MDRLAAMTTFVIVVDTGSFTAAATVLNLPKSRISQRISDLERHLGVHLLHRSTRALSLTEDGRAYLAKCRAIVQEIEELEISLNRDASAPRGRLRVEALASIARWVIGPRIHEFRARYPEITLRMGSGDRIRPLLEEGIDCTIRGGPLDDSNLIARHVCDIRLGLYAAPSYLAARNALASPSELIAHDRISWFAGRRGSSVWRLVCGGEGADVPETSGLHFDDPDVAIASCIAGGGICPAAPFAVEGYVKAGLLAPVLPRWHFPPRPIHIIYPRGQHLSARVRCFVDWSFDVMRASPSLRLSPADLVHEMREGSHSPD